MLIMRPLPRRRPRRPPQLSRDPCPGPSLSAHHTPQQGRCTLLIRRLTRLFLSHQPAPTSSLEITRDLHPLDLPSFLSLSSVKTAFVIPPSQQAPRPKPIIASATSNININFLTRSLGLRCSARSRVLYLLSPPLTTHPSNPLASTL